MPNAEAPRPTSMDKGPMRTTGIWAVCIGLAGVPLALLMFMVEHQLETDYGSYAFSGAVVMIATVLLLLAPFSLLFGLMALRSWSVFVVVVLVGGAFILYLSSWLRHGRVITNESAAISNLRTINTAEATYEASDGKGSYGTIQQLIDSRLLESEFNASRAGYVFQISVTSNGKDYKATAWPARTETGKYAYYTTTDAVVRYTTEHGGPCDPCFPKGQAGQAVQ